MATGGEDIDLTKGFRASVRWLDKERKKFEITIEHENKREWRTNVTHAYPRSVVIEFVPDDGERGE